MIHGRRSTIGIRLTEAGDFLIASDLLDAFNNLLRLLSEIDIGLSPQLTRTVDWSVHRIQRSSPAVLELEPIVREDQLDNRDAVIHVAMSGITALNEKDERPNYFSDQALDSARRLVSVLGPRVHRIDVFTPDESIVCTEAISANVREILHPWREMVGSVEGVLEAMNSHSGFKFSLYEPVLATRIACELDRDALPNLKGDVVSLYEQKVRVSGTLKTNRRGEVRSATIQAISPLRSEPRFRSVEDIAGIYDITGGLDAEEYVRRMRDA